jgi:hypothetical protein
MDKFGAGDASVKPGRGNLSKLEQENVISARLSTNISEIRVGPGTIVHEPFPR